MPTAAYTSLSALPGRPARTAPVAAPAAPLRIPSPRRSAASTASPSRAAVLRRLKRATRPPAVAAATGQSDSDAADAAAGAALPRRRWLAPFTLPGPGFADGHDYHDVLFASAPLHVANHLIFGALYVLGGLAYWGSERSALAAYLVAAGATLFTEGLVHWRSNKIHAVHAISVWTYNAYVCAFLAAGGLDPVLAGPRDALYALFWLGPVLFGMMYVPATSVITFMRPAKP